MKSLIIGYGEVGKGLHKVIGGDVLDKDLLQDKQVYDIIHICFPYSDKFVDYVKEYQKMFNPTYTVIHSTVPIGTSKQVNAVHSPIRGVHPDLDKGIKTFMKFFGGEKSKEVAEWFNQFGLETHTTPNSDDTEALKLWDTTQYGVMILLNKEIHKFCEENGLDFDIVYTLANQTYNEGYIKLGRSEVVRPVLKYTEGKIGGHCVYQNTALFNSESTKRIKDYQENICNSATQQTS